MPSPDQVGSPFRAAASLPVNRGFGGRINAQAELAIHALGNSYTLEGTGTVTALPAIPIGELVFLHVVGTPTFKNSAKLMCPSATNYLAAAGDFVIARSLGDGVWQIYSLSNNFGSAAVRADTDFLRTDTAQSLTAAAKKQAGVNLATSTNDSASAGGIGEYIELSLSSASPVTLGNNAYQTPTSTNAGISLSPGDWDISGVSNFTPSGQVLTAIISGISLTSNASPIDDFAQSRIDYSAANPAGGFPSLATPVVRMSISTTTSVFLTCRASFSSGTVTAYGKIRARRVR